MRRGFVVLAVVVVAVPAAAELWLRADREAGPPPPPAPPAIEAPERPRAAPLLVLGGEFTCAAGLRAGERWSDRLAARVTGAAGFSEVVVGAPLADPSPFLETALSSLARTSEAPAARGLNAVHHDHGADVVLFEAGGDALGADAAPFVIGSPRPEPQALATPERRRPLALLEWYDRWRAGRRLDEDERAVARLVATDGFVAGASANARVRLEELTAAVASRRPNESAARFLRALIGELHGLGRIAARERAIANWRRIFGRLRMEQRSTILILTGPSLLQVGLDQLALSFAIPTVHAPPVDLDPRLRIDNHDPQMRIDNSSRAAAAVHAEVADAVWATLTKRGILPPAMEAPAAAASLAESIDAAARARGGIDQALITLAHAWLLERCELGATPPPEALFGVGERGRLAPDVPAEIVLKRPALPDELVVAASVRAGTAALPRLKLRHATGELLLEPRAMTSPSAKEGDRVRIEYRAAAPPTKEVVAWPAYDLTLVVEPDAADPEFELATVELTRQPE
jgi:hypothetical protein